MVSCESCFDKKHGSPLWKLVVIFIIFFQYIYIYIYIYVNFLTSCDIFVSITDAILFKIHSFYYILELFINNKYNYDFIAYIYIA